MHIHRFEKLWLGVALLLIVGFIATITYGAIGAGVEMVDDKGGQVDPQALDEHPEFSDPGVVKTGPNEYHVYIVARQFSYNPGTPDVSRPIRVPTDANVTFHITSGDVIHGFELAGTNINTMVIPGQVATIKTRFDEADTYGIVCHEYCGANHHNMEGKVVAVPSDQYTYNGTSGNTTNATAGVSA
ncbi:cytochrome c oxidase subunit II [Haloarchaeobius sp. HME9146]|uniref:cytochrome c oxidase subunit II n=1 Tax=Haloarchaeobius sp. HME9146 TaxID=2978732 RepID=UPI0021C00424|nr:cytochrome c oxidase subunit II [Haloarchaeobius sp. HME9146]MCT9094582.1 cytochrome c oxidase subunit II [Haloarchaeobius sp. HME9146]